MPKWLNQPGQR